MSDEDDVPDLVDSESDEAEDISLAKDNTESAKVWFRMPRFKHRTHYQVMKINLLSPFLFGQVNQPDKWTSWAFDHGLLPSRTVFRIDPLSREFLDAVELVEEAHDKLQAAVDEKTLVEILDLVDKINDYQYNMSSKAVNNAEKYPLFKKICDGIQGGKKDTKMIAILLAARQLHDHVNSLTKHGQNPVSDYENQCRAHEKQSTELKKTGNDSFSKGLFKQAIQSYTKALYSSAFNHILYGNRAQSYLKTNDYWSALCDGKRAVVLKFDWPKGNYRLAEAYFHLGMIERALAVNANAMKVCKASEAMKADMKDIEQQAVRFKEEKEKRQKLLKSETANGSIPDIDDVPGLVEPGSSDDESSSDDYNDDDHCSEDDMPGLLSDQEFSDDDSITRKTTKAKTESSKPKPKKGSDKHGPSKPTKINKQPKTKTSQKVKRDVPVDRDTQIRLDFQGHMSQGTIALLEGRVRNAIYCYSNALEMSSEHALLLKPPLIVIVVLKYSLGQAYATTELGKDLQAACIHFKDIIEEHTSITFPLAHHGLGSVYIKQNRYPEARTIIKRGLDVMLVPSAVIDLHNWPGSHKVIELSDPGKLKGELLKLLSMCVSPPRPDAVCRYSECTGFFQKSIFLTDPDFKGFVRMECSEKCRIEFHPTCYKKNRTAMHMIDKDFLLKDCSTPDCTGQVISLVLYDQDGRVKKRCQADNPPPRTKEKKVIQRMKASGRYRLERKRLQKARRKEAKERARREKFGLPAEAEETESSVCSSDNLDLVQDVLDRTSPMLEEPMNKETPEVVLNTQPQVLESVKANGAFGYVLKKDKEEEAGGQQKDKKTKQRKKKSKEKPASELMNFQFDPPHLSTRLSAADAENMPDPGSFLPPQQRLDTHQGPFLHQDRPFALPEHLQEQARQLEAGYGGAGTVDADWGPSFSNVASLNTNKPDPVKENLHSYFASLLSEGPLSLDSPKLIQDLENFPPEAKMLIDNAGSLKAFLLASCQFVASENMVCLLKDAAKLRAGTNRNTPSPLNPTAATFTPRSSPDTLSDDSPVPQLMTPSDNSLQSSPDLSSSAADDAPNSVDDTAGLRASFLPEGDTGLLKATGLDNILDEDFDDEDMHSAVSSLCSSKGLEDFGALEVPRETFLPTTTAESTMVGSPLQQSVAQPPAPQSPPDHSNSEEISLSQTLACGLNTMVANMVANKDTTESVDSGFHSVHDDSVALGSRAQQCRDSQRDNMSADSLWASGKLWDNTSATVASGDTNQGTNPATPVKMDTLDTDFCQGAGHQYKAPGSPIQRQLKPECKEAACQAAPATDNAAVNTPPQKNFKEDYLRVVQEKDRLSALHQEALDRSMQVKRNMEAELKATQAGFVEMQTRHQKAKDELVAMSQERDVSNRKWQQEKKELSQQVSKLQAEVKTLKKGEEAQKKAAQDVSKEFMSLSKERDRLTAEKVKLEDSVLKLESNWQTAHRRAQEAEVLVLQTRRDHACQMLERAMKEADMYVQNLAKQCAAQPNVAELRQFLAGWQDNVNDCRKKISLCKHAFEEHIQKVKKGHAFSSLPAIVPPMPPPPPPVPQVFKQSSRGAVGKASPQVVEPQTSPPPPGSQAAPVSHPHNQLAAHQQSNATASSHKPMAAHQQPIAATSHKPMAAHQQPIAATHKPMAANQQPVAAMPSHKPMAGHQQPNAAAPHKPMAATQQPNSATPSPITAQPPAQPMSNTQELHVAAGHQPNLATQNQQHPAQQTMNKPPAVAAGSQPKQAPPSLAAVPPPHVAPPNLAAQQTNGQPVRTAGVQIPRVANHGAALSNLTLSQQASKNSFEKIIEKLSSMFPSYSRHQLTDVIKEVRQANLGSLSGLSLEEIIHRVAERILQRQMEEQKRQLRKQQFIRQQQGGAPVRPHQQQQPQVLGGGHGRSHQSGPPPGWNPPMPQRRHVATLNDDESDCIICQEEMTQETVCQLECGHLYHVDCIRKWLKQQSTCPTCRVHALLPDEFPSLGGTKWH